MLKNRGVAISNNALEPEKKEGTVGTVVVLAWYCFPFSSGNIQCCTKVSRSENAGGKQNGLPGKLRELYSFPP